MQREYTYLCQQMVMYVDLAAPNQPIACPLSAAAPPSDTSWWHYCNPRHDALPIQLHSTTMIKNTGPVNNSQNRHGVHDDVELLRIMVEHDVELLRIRVSC
jgi:hypothetical protein